MSVRDSNYLNYGISNRDVRMVFEFCQSDSFDYEDLYNIAKLVNESIAGSLADSISQSISYEKLSRYEYIPISKNDFYGYRRKCIALYFKMRKKEIMKECI